MFSQYEDQIYSGLGRLNCPPLKLMERFYDELFQSAPELRPLFQTDMQLQYQKLFDAILLVIESLNDLTELAKELEAMGKRHLEYGTQEAHYRTVGHSFITALSHSIDGWSAVDEKAWSTIYTYIANTMIEGASRGEPVRILS